MIICLYCLLNTLQITSVTNICVCVYHKDLYIEIETYCRVVPGHNNL